MLVMDVRFTIIWIHREAPRLRNNREMIDDLRDPWRRPCSPRRFLPLRP
jgi:hypothetical protein